MVRPSWRMSWDAILFILLWSAQFWSSELSGALIPTDESTVLIPYLTRIWYYAPAPAFLLLALFAYVLADLLLEGRRQFAVKLIALVFVIVAFVVLPTMAAIVFRHNTAPYLYIHDGAIQTEEAIKFLLANENPYAESYAATPMAQWRFNESGVGRNLAIDHLPYLPFTFLSAIPLYLVAQATLGWYDQRFVSLILLSLAVLMLLRVGRTPGEKLASITVLSLNPLSIPFFIEGRNDIMVSFWLIGGILLLQRRRVSWAGIFIACAAVSKQTAWFIIPFFVFYALQIERNSNPLKQLVKRARVLVPAALVFVGILLPFLIWDAGAFLDDVLSVPFRLPAAGAIYPIRSLGFGGLALGLGWIKQSTDPFPFSWLQMLFGGLGLIFLLYSQWRNNTLTQVLMNYAVLLFICLFFARSFVDNYLGFALTWLVLPALSGDAVNRTEERLRVESGFR